MNAPEHEYRWTTGGHGDEVEKLVQDFQRKLMNESRELQAALSAATGQQCTVFVDWRWNAL